MLREAYALSRGSGKEPAHRGARRVHASPPNRTAPELRRSGVNSFRITLMLVLLLGSALLLAACGGSGGGY
jgi:hypothetical protein